MSLLRFACVSFQSLFVGSVCAHQKPQALGCNAAAGIFERNRCAVLRVVISSCTPTSTCMQRGLTDTEPAGSYRHDGSMWQLPTVRLAL